MRTKNRYYIKESKLGTWTIIDRITRREVYDGELHGNDKPLKFMDEDDAQRCMDAMNNSPEEEA